MADSIAMVGCDQRQERVTLRQFDPKRFQSVVSAKAREFVHDLSIDQDIRIGTLGRSLTKVTNHAAEDKTARGVFLG